MKCQGPAFVEGQMKRVVVATLGAVAIVGTFGVNLSAQFPKPGTTTRIDTVGEARQRPDCDKLAELRHELARLHQELRRLQDAFLQAKQAGNRERAEQILHEIRRVNAQIPDVQQQIRRLDQVCGR